MTVRISSAQQHRILIASAEEIARVAHVTLKENFGIEPPSLETLTRLSLIAHRSGLTEPESIFMFAMSSCLCTSHEQRVRLLAIADNWHLSEIDRVELIRLAVGAHQNGE